jgi:(4-O-methyl)-D-glucuronate---lignin esterase
MKPSLLLLIVISFFACNQDNHLNRQNIDTYDILLENFKNPPAMAHPKVYWWCLNGNIDTITAKEELRAMKDAGISGFDLFEIGVPKEDTMIPGGPSFLSDESLQIIKFVVDEAGKLGLTVGLNLASSWNAGGRWIEPKNGGKSLYFSKTKLKGKATKQSIKLPFPEISFPKASLIGGTDKPMIPFKDNGKPVYYEEIAVLALPASFEKSSLDTCRIIDVTSFFDPENDILNWEAPQGNWEIYRYVCSNSGQQLVLPSPQSAGLTIDHFDSTAVETHLMYIIDRLKPVLGDFRNTALKSFYLASYEARGFVWTSTMSSEFKKVNGYDIYKFLPSLFDQKVFSKETTVKIQSDFKKTLSELMINNLYKKSKEICNSYGLKINCEAGGPGFPLYNGPAEPLKALGALDIPRGEFWINHARLYMDSNGKDSIDVLRVVKEVAAASHIYEKGIVEEEAFTSFQHWQEGPKDMKPLGDRAFCEGMNKVVFHGFSHNPSGSGFPGFVYHAGTHFNNKRVWWPKAGPFIDYISRVSSVFQNADFVSDVLYYYGDKVPNSATPKNAHFSVGPGYDYEVINTEILLNNLTVKNGKLVLSNGAEFSILALEPENVIHPAVLSKLSELANQGAKITGQKPGKVADLKTQTITVSESEDLLDKIWTEVDDPSGFGLKNKGKVYSGIKPLEILNALNISPDINYSDKETFLLDFIHYSKNDVDFYYITNTTNEWISRECAFRQQNKVPEIWNPVSGEIIPVTIYNQGSSSIDLPVTLPPYGSLFVVFKESPALFHYTSVNGIDDNPPLLEFTNKGICFLQDGIFELKNNIQVITINNNSTTYTIDGSWDVAFTNGWGAPEKVVFPELMSWTLSKDKGVKYYSGIACYNKTFQYDLNSVSTKDQQTYLDLGEISKVGEVWLNDTRLGITWTKPYRFNVTDILKQGENTLKVEIANTWSNRLKGDALTGQKYTNTNIKNTIVAGNSIKSTDQTRVPWKDVPLIESGLLGPVTISSLSSVIMP